MKICREETLRGRTETTQFDALEKCGSTDVETVMAVIEDDVREAWGDVDDAYQYGDTLEIALSEGHFLKFTVIPEAADA